MFDSKEKIKFTHKRANKSLSDLNQGLSGSSTQATKLQLRLFMGSQPLKVPMISLTIDIDNESTNRAFIASIISNPKLPNPKLPNPKIPKTK